MSNSVEARLGLERQGIDNDDMSESMMLVAAATEKAAMEIRDDLADAMRRLDMISFPIAAARLSQAIDAVDAELAGLASLAGVPELG